MLPGETIKWPPESIHQVFSGDPGIMESRTDFVGSHVGTRFHDVLPRPAEDVLRGTASRYQARPTSSKGRAQRHECPLCWLSRNWLA